MKILTIRFENIHSLKGEHRIDFGSGILAEAGLFAITGPTGSGKSTLLDVITLALYNRIARVDKSMTKRSLEDDGSIMTRNMKSCFAEVEYEVKGKKYRSHWSIERNRNNNLNDRKQEVVEISTGTILESGTRVPEKNEAIIGLSYSQFSKAIVLAQGEFSKLLQAPRNERNKLLEDITGARSYRTIGRAVFLKYREIEKNVSLKKAKLEGIQLLPKEEIEEREKELTALNKQKPEIEKKYREASQKIDLRKDHLQKQEDEKELRKNKEEIAGQIDEFKEKANRLKLHERFSKYNPFLQEYVRLRNEKQRIAKSIESFISEREKEEKSLNDHLTAASELLKKDISSKEAIQLLEDFRNSVLKLQQDENTKFQESNSKKSQIQVYVRAINQLGFRLANPESPGQFSAAAKPVTSEIKEIIENSGFSSLQNLKQEIQTLKDQTLLGLDIVNKKEKQLLLEEDLQTAIKESSRLKDQIKSGSKRISDLEKEIPELRKEIAVLKEKKEIQLVRQSLDDHRKKLKPKEPCPLCGSADHPFAEHRPVFDLEESLLDEKEDNLNLKNSLLSQTGETIRLLNKELKKQNQIREKLEAELSGLIKQSESLIREMNWSKDLTAEEMKNLHKKIKLRGEKLEKIIPAFEAAIIFEEIRKLFREWHKLIQNYISLKKRREVLYKGNQLQSDVDGLSKKITRSVTKIDSCSHQISNYKKEKEGIASDFEKHGKQLERILFDENLESFSELRAFILDEETAAGFRKMQTELNNRKLRLEEQEKSLETVLKKMREKDDLSVSLEDLKENHEKTGEEMSQVSQRIGEINSILESDKKYRVLREQELEELKLLKKDLKLWKTMYDLIGDATGDKFSNFVQDLTLEQLIGFTNQRLADFSDRYLLDIPTAEEASRSDTLKVIDKYMGDSRRSIHTISGGETFLVSLAMAIALSDIASKNVAIQSLFIDEGFGSLDPENLDQAISILEKMQHESDKSIGVISHVGALKERITTQIRLNKSGLGYSSLEIVQ